MPERNSFGSESADVPFVEHGGKTLLTIQWAPHAAAEAERQTFTTSHASMQQGWTGTLDQLDTYLASAKLGENP